MKKAAIIHEEIVTQYFQNGIEIVPTVQQKLLVSLFPSQTEIIKKVTTFTTEIAEVKFRSGKELNAKFWEVAEEFKNFIHPNNLKIVVR